jgi:hypothetical protein
MEVHTFTSELLRNKIEFKKKKFEEYPKYVFSAHNTLRRKLKDDTGYSFIMRQTKNAKTEIAFLDIQNIDRFNQSKMGILTTVLENFNDRFSSIAHLEFESITDYKALDYTRSVANENKQAIFSLLSIKPIKIVDCINDEYSKIFCKEICDLLFSKYGIKVSYGKRIAKDHLNIRVIHNAAFYADSEDPHRVFDDVAVQHITFEDFSECSEFAIATVIHEMLIKDDLVKQKISLFDWNTLGFKEDIDFGIEATDEQNTKYMFLLEWMQTHKEQNELIMKAMKGSFPRACDQVKELLPEGLPGLAKEYITSQINQLFDQGYEEGVIRQQDVSKRMIVFWGNMMQYAVGLIDSGDFDPSGMSLEEHKQFTYECMVKALN